MTIIPRLAVNHDAREIEQRQQRLLAMYIAINSPEALELVAHQAGPRHQSR